MTNNTSETGNLFQQVAADGQQLAQRLERGQAETPLASHFNQLLNELDTPAFSITVLGLTTNDRSHILSWIYGSQYAVLSLQSSNQVGLLELHLRDRGFSLETGNGQRVEFDTASAFIEAIQSTDLVQSGDENSWLDPVKLSLEAPPGLQSISIYMPVSSEMVLRNPSMMSHLISKSNVLFLAGPLDYALSQEDQKAIEELLGIMDGVWPIVIVPEDIKENELPTNGWWNNPVLTQGAIKLLPLKLAATDTTGLPPLMNNAQDPIRRAFTELHMAQRFQRAIQAVSERLDAESRQLKTAHSREQRRLSSFNAPEQQTNFRQQFDAIKTDIVDEFSALIKGIHENNRKALLPSGAIHQHINRLLENLKFEDLQQETEHKTIKLTVTEEFLRHTTQSLKSDLKSQLREEMAMLRDGLIDIQDRFTKQLEAVCERPADLTMQLPEDKIIWQSIKEMLEMEIRYKGEMPKRGFMQRLGEGRKLVFMVLMTMSVVGSMVGFNIRTARFIGLFFLLLFIGGVAYTYMTWRKEDEARLHKELDRVRDQLHSEVKRLVSDIHRDKASRIAEFIEKVKRDCMRQLDGLGKEMEACMLKQATQSRDETQKKQAMVEQHMRELQPITQQLLQLVQQGESLQQQCHTNLKAAFGIT